MVIYDVEGKLTIEINDRKIKYDPDGERSIEWLLGEVGKAYGDDKLWIMDRASEGEQEGVIT